MSRSQPASACSKPFGSGSRASTLASLRLEKRASPAQHRDVIAALFGTLFLVFFALSPLQWVELGMPWLTLAISFLIIPLLDVAVGRPRPEAQRPPLAFARWIPRLQLPLQAMLLLEAMRIAPSLEAWQFAV